MNNLNNQQQALLGSQIFSGIFNSFSNYFNQKSNSYYQQSQLYQQAQQQYREISAKIRTQMNQQANSYLQSGVDVSQGTAIYVINHKNMQGQEMMRETAENLAISIKNTKKVNLAEANINLMSNLANTGLQATQTYLNFDLKNQQLHNKGAKLFGEETAKKNSGKKYIWRDPTNNLLKDFGTNKWYKKI